MGGIDVAGHKMAKRGIDLGAEQNASATLASANSQVSPPPMAGMDHGTMAGMDHGSMSGMDKAMDMGAMSMRDFSHAQGVEKSAGVATIAAMPKDRPIIRDKG